MHVEPVLSSPPALSRKETEEELHHLLSVGLVRERTQLHALLSYLVSKALDPPEFLKEYTIGVEALGKPDDYDPRIDPSVRVEISKLRKRLRDYYMESGATRPIRLEIPHGSYLPVLKVTVPAASVEHGGRRGWHWPWLAAAGLLLAAAVLVPAWRLRTNRFTPALEAFWQPHIEGKIPTLLVCGAPLFLKVQGGFYRDTNVNRPEDAAGSTKVQRIIEALKPDEVRPVFTFVGMGEAHGVFEVTRLLASRGVALTLRRSNEVSWEDLKGRHVIFFGGRKYNPQIPLLPYEPKFEAANRRILNTEPVNGEPSEYRTASITPYGEITAEYALISVYPGITPNTRLLTLDCSSTEGTLAAAEFLTREDMLRQLVSRGIPLKPERGKFRAFQVVIGAKYNKGVVVGLSYVTHRVLEASGAWRH